MKSSTVMLVCLLGIVSSQVIVLPSEDTASVGGSATFQCLSLNGEEFNRTQWLLNESSLDSIDQSQVEEIFSPNIGGVLQLTDLTADFNGTRVKCRADMSSGITIETDYSVLWMQANEVIIETTTLVVTNYDRQVSTAEIYSMDVTDENFATSILEEGSTPTNEKEFPLIGVVAGTTSAAVIAVVVIIILLLVFKPIKWLKSKLTNQPSLTHSPLSGEGSGFQTEPKTNVMETPIKQVSPHSSVLSTQEDLSSEHKNDVSILYLEQESCEESTSAEMEAIMTPNNVIPSPTTPSTTSSEQRLLSGNNQSSDARRKLDFGADDVVKSSQPPNPHSKENSSIALVCSLVAVKSNIPPNPHSKENFHFKAPSSKRKGLFEITNTPRMQKT